MNETKEPREYAPPFDPETFKAEWRNHMKWLLIILFVVTLGSIWDLIHPSYLSTRITHHVEGGKTLSILIRSFGLIFLLIIFVNSAKMYNRRIKQITTDDGWMSLSILTIIYKHLGAFILIYISLIYIYSYFSIQYLPYPYIGVFMYVFGLILLYGWVTFPTLYNRRFNLAHDKVVNALKLESALIMQNGIWGSNIFGYNYLQSNDQRITITKWKSDQTNVTIETSKNEPERNRQLREAVAAVLEGRSPVSSQAAGLAGEGRQAGEGRKPGVNRAF